MRFILSIFRERYLQDLVGWLALDESVMPVMGAFLSGLGVEGTDTFLSILQAETLLAAGATPIIKVFVALMVDKNASYMRKSADSHCVKEGMRRYRCFTVN